VSRTIRKNRPITCLACDRGGSHGPLRKLEIYYHDGTCKTVVDDCFAGMKSYLADAQTAEVPVVKPETGISVASGYVPGDK